MDRTSQRIEWIVLTMLGATLSFTPVYTAQADAVGTGGIYVPLTYTRLMDTRTASGTPLDAGEVRDLQLLGRAGIPLTDVGAVVIDVTATTTTAWVTLITAWSAGAMQPTTPNLRVNSDSVPRTNTVIVRPGKDGKIAVKNSAGQTDINIDVQGYFTEANSASGGPAGGYVPVTPARVLDYTTIPAGGHIDVSVGGVSGVTSDAIAAFINFSVRNATADGELVAVPTGSSTRACLPMIGALGRDC